MLYYNYCECLNSELDTLTQPTANCVNAMEILSYVPLQLYPMSSIVLQMSNSNDKKMKIEDNDEDQDSHLCEFDDEEYDEQYIPVPLDGGYGWVIMCASFVTNMLVDGVCFCVGIFILKMLEEFQETKAKTSWVGSVLNGMYLSMGKYSGCFNPFFQRATQCSIY